MAHPALIASWLLLLSCRSDGGKGPPGSTPVEAPTGETAVVDATGTTGATGGDTATAGPLPPNILLVISDDQGVDKVASYQAHPAPPPTPTLDGLAARGVSFDRAYALPSCSPSRSALLTGRMPHRTGLGTVIQYLDDEELPADSPSMARMLHTSPWPWKTAAFGKWHLSSYESDHGWDHPLELGFGEYAGGLGNLWDRYLDRHVPHGYTYWDKVEDGALHVETTYATTDTVDDALDAIGRLEEPWLVYVSLHAPHIPLHQPPDGLADPVVDATGPNLYDAAVQALDTELGRLLGAVDVDDTLVVFTSDNGTESFGIRAPANPRHGKLTAYEGGIRVPLIVAGPGVMEGARSQALVHLVDLVPTVADVAQVDLSSSILDGESLWPYLRDPAATGRDMLHAGTFLPNGRGDANLHSETWVSHGPRIKAVRFERGPVAFVDLVEDPEEEDLVLSVDDLPEARRAEAQALVDAQQAFFEGIDIPSW